MAFNINEVVAEMISAIKSSVKNDWKLIKDTANDFLDSKKERLELLASLRIQNEINEEFFLKRLKDEKKILESELHAMAVITKAAAERAANAAFEVLGNAINAAIHF